MAKIKTLAEPKTSLTWIDSTDPAWAEAAVLGVLEWAEKENWEVWEFPNNEIPNRVKYLSDKYPTWAAIDVRKQPHVVLVRGVPFNLAKYNRLSSKNVMGYLGAGLVLDAKRWIGLAEYLHNDMNTDFCRVVIVAIPGAPGHGSDGEWFEATQQLAKAGRAEIWRNSHAGPATK